MKDTHFITSMLALKAWQDGHEEGLDAMLGIAFTIRNRVRAGWYNGDWISVLSHHDEWSARIEPPTSQIPDTRSYAFMVFLQKVDSIFSGAQEDNITVKPDGEWRTIMATPPPVALYYARLDQITNPWFMENISRQGDKHPRVAQVGQLFFFA